MHVALSGYFWGQPHTGSGQYTRHLWVALSSLVSRLPDKDKYRLSLLLPDMVAKTGGSNPKLALERSEGSKIQSLPSNEVKGPKSKIGKLLWEQWGGVQEARRQGAHLLHVPYLAAPLVKRMPLAVTAHDMIPWVVPGYSDSLAVRLYLALAAAGVKRADLVIADSEASRRDVIRVLKVPPTRVHTVYLGVDPPPDYTQEQLDEARVHFNLPHNYAFYLGGFDRRKNVPLLLRTWRAAFEQYAGDDAPALAIGGAIPQPGGVFPDVRSEAVRLGFGDNTNGPVRFLGRISDADKSLLMAAARIFIYPSAYEGFGLDPLEAMSNGCPVVSSSGGSLKEVVGDVGLLVAPNDERALCEAIVRAWSDHALRDRLSVQGKQRASQFTWQRTAQQTWDLYANVKRET